MKKIQNNAFKGLTYSVSALALVMSASAVAQDANSDEDGSTDEEPVVVTDSSADSSQGGTPIVVTGSRIKRDTYSSISPLQVLTTEQSQETGLFDPSQILQRSESASGQQIDATFQGFVLNNGPGSVTLNLRGLGADRTLLMINGRRLAPAGVEGAPTSPSLNFQPTRWHHAAGIRTEPAVSVPMPISASPRETASAEPPEEPPATRPGITGFSMRRPRS